MNRKLHLSHAKAGAKAPLPARCSYCMLGMVHASTIDCLQTAECHRYATFTTMIAFLSLRSWHLLGTCTVARMTLEDVVRGGCTINTGAETSLAQIVRILLRSLNWAHSDHLPKTVTSRGNSTGCFLPLLALPSQCISGLLERPRSPVRWS